MNPFKGLFHLSLGLACSSAVSCSGFSKEWKQAVAQPIPNDHITGPWEGSWRSESNDHTGKLRCIVTAPKDGGNVYRFHYWATWNLFSGAYRAQYPVEKRSDTWHFSGETDLGRLAGGIYHHQGTATSVKFNARYTSKADEGFFEMKRPPRQE